MWDRDLMRSRPGVWLRSAIAGLLTRPVLGYVRVADEKDNAQSRLEPLWPNRTLTRFPYGQRRTTR